MKKRSLLLVVVISLISRFTSYSQSGTSNSEVVMSMTSYYPTIKFKDSNIIKFPGMNKGPLLLDLKALYSDLNFSPFSYINPSDWFSANHLYLSGVTRIELAIYSLDPYAKEGSPIYLPSRHLYSLIGTFNFTSKGMPLLAWSSGGFGTLRLSDEDDIYAKTNLPLNFNSKEISVEKANIKSMLYHADIYLAKGKNETYNDQFTQINKHISKNISLKNIPIIYGKNFSNPFAKNTTYSEENGKYGSVNTPVIVKITLTFDKNNSTYSENKRTSLFVSGPFKEGYLTLPYIGSIAVGNGIIYDCGVRTPLNEIMNSNKSIARFYREKLFAQESIWKKDALAKNDILIENHRGVWGIANYKDKLGNIIPNTETTAECTFKAFTNALPVEDYTTRIVEMDLTKTKDDTLFFMHDYYLKRLTNYSGEDFTFNLTWNDLKDLFVRDRFGNLTTSKILRFEELARHIIKQDNSAILVLDIKEGTTRKENGVCKDGCQFSDYNSTIDFAKIIKLLETTLDKLKFDYPYLDPYKNIIIKTYENWNKLSYVIGKSTLDKFLWVPMIVTDSHKFTSVIAGETKQDILKMCKFIGDWETMAGGNVPYFETNFKNDDDIALKPFEISYNANSFEGPIFHFVGSNTQFDAQNNIPVQKKTIEAKNIMDFVRQFTGKRSGIFSEDPVGSKGTVNRWGKWSIKDASKDKRGDILWLLRQPFGNKMVITTDRPDVVQQLLNK